MRAGPTVVAHVVIAVLLAASGSAQDLSAFEPVFVPFFGADIKGVGGSHFLVAGTSIPRAPYAYWPHCDFSSTTPTFGRVDLHGLGPIVCVGGTMGRVLYVERNAADQISYGYVLSSSPADAAGTFHASIPVARERDFKRGRFHIVVPRGYGRVMLRVYELRGREGAAVRVRALASVLGWGGGTADTVSLTRREGSDPSYPLFAEVPLNLNCFVVSPRICTEWDAAIEIEPAVDGEYWAVVSRTHDTTQQVSLYWPQ